MAKVITVANQKGGVSKTTTALALISGLTEKGYKVLGIDLDAQCSSSYVMNVTSSKDVLGVLLGQVKIEEAIQHTDRGDFIIASYKLADADRTFPGSADNFKLKKALSQVADKYDYIVIDTPPALNVLLMNALISSDYIIIPVTPDIFSFQGLTQLYENIYAVQETGNADLKILGLLLTQIDTSVLSREMKTQFLKVAEEINSKVFETTIRKTVAVKEAQFTKQTLNEYSPTATATTDYKNFVEELLKEMEA